MRVLITGGTGFFGSRLVRAMVERGDEVCLVRRRTSSLARLGNVSERIEHLSVDDGVAAPFAHGPFDAVVHTATCYGRHGEDDRTICEGNVAWPTRLLLEASRRDVPLFVNTDTSLPPALTAYARTKRLFATRVREVAVQERIAALNVRLESVYGPGDDPGKFNTQLLHAMLRDVPCFPLTPGEQRRDFIFVDDAADAFLRLVDHARVTQEAYVHAGVGRGEPVSIRMLAETMKRLTGARTRLDFGALPYRAGELMLACADTSVLRTLGWAGARPLEQGLGATIERERVLLAEMDA